MYTSPRTGKKLTIIATLLASTFATPALAEDATSQPEETGFWGKWKSSAEASVIVTSGNTSTTTLRGKIDARQQLEEWKNQYVFDTLFKREETTNADGEQENRRSAERYFLSAQGNYKLETEHSFLLLYAAHLEDKFGSFRSNSIVSGGYGYRLLDTDEHTIDAEIGPGYRYGEKDSGEEVKGFIVRASGVYAWKISDSANFEQKLSIETGSGNTFTKSESYVSAKLNGSLRMKFGFVVSHNSNVDAGKENTDTETTMTLVYQF